MFEITYLFIVHILIINRFYLEKKPKEYIFFTKKKVNIRVE